MNLIVNLFSKTFLTSALITAVLLLVSALVYLWAIVFHFRQPESSQSIKMKLTAWFGALTTMIHLITVLSLNAVEPWQVSLSILLGLTGLGIFAAAIHETSSKGLFLAFSGRVPDAIVSTGVYSWIRHPFYTAYTCTFLMGSVYTLNVFAIITTMVMIWLYTLAAQDEHKWLESSELKDSYRAYRASTDHWQRWFGASKDST